MSTLVLPILIPPVESLYQFTLLKELIVIVSFKQTGEFIVTLVGAFGKGVVTTNIAFPLGFIQPKSEIATA